MKIIIEDPAQNEEDTVIIRVKSVTDDIMRAINILKSPDTITVYYDNRAVILLVGDIYYIESVDLKTFVYAKESVYRSKLKLYEIEDILGSGDFLRISKQVIVNIRKIKSVQPAGGGRFTAELTNKERIIISRQYVPAMKEMFGL